MAIPSFHSFWAYTKCDISRHISSSAQNATLCACVNLLEMWYDVCIHEIGCNLRFKTDFHIIQKMTFCIHFI